MAGPDNLSQARERVTVLLAQRGDREAFSSLCDLYDRRLLYFIRRILGDSDSPLDVLQCVWLTVHRKLKNLKSPDAFRVWLYRIAHDAAVTELRKTSRYSRTLEEIPAVPWMESANVSETAFDNAELIHLAMQVLTIDHRRVLTLHFLEHMTIEEIAEVIGCSSGTVKSRLYYAKIALRESIEGLSNE